MIYFAYLLATLCSLGCFGLPLWAAWSCWDDGDNGLAVAIGLIGWPIGCLLAVLPWTFISEVQSPDLATLHESLPVRVDCHRTLVRLNCLGVTIQ